MLVGGAVAASPARLVSPAEALHVQAAGARYVSRGGSKLAAGLDAFEIPVAGRRALDAGASTGGFTDCLLQRGAERVVAVDVGYGQFDARLRADPRVVLVERTNVRHLTFEGLQGADPGFRPVDLVVADLSFISLTTVMDVLSGPCARPGADMVLLVKPQFESGRQEMAKSRGVVRDPAIWRGALERVARSVGAHRGVIMGIVPSPLTGPKGNVEFLLAARTAEPDAAPKEVAAMIDEALAAVAEGQAAGRPGGR